MLGPNGEGSGMENFTPEERSQADETLTNMGMKAPESEASEQAVTVEEAREIMGDDNVLDHEWFAKVMEITIDPANVAPIHLTREDILEAAERGQILMFVCDTDGSPETGWTLQ